MNISISFWIGFIVFVLVMLSLDLFVFHKKNTAVKVKEALLWSLFWVGLAVAFNFGVFFMVGKVKALEFLTGYLIEESLSVDNLFVFILIFGFFKIEPKYQHNLYAWYFYLCRRGSYPTVRLDHVYLRCISGLYRHPFIIRERR